MKEILKNVKEKLTSKYLENNSLKSGNILKDVKEKLTAKYLEKKSSKNIKKFKPRIKARLRKNKQIINKNIDNFFGWIKGAELVELKECNTAEDPVRPELDVSFRTSNGRKIYGVKYKKEIHAVMCFAFTNKVPKNVEELDKFSQDAHLQSTLRGQNVGQIAIAYTVWSKKKGGGKLIVNEVFKKIKKSNHLNRLVTLSPLTKMATKFHSKNGAKLLQVNENSQNFEYEIIKN
ncbi:hypothetical protein IDH15_01800 [Pelagibacterales bacterium SAG-MED38]|nr:hypothetical protein [Pelagibacterales bacterium SAG-MED38]